MLYHTVSTEQQLVHTNQQLSMLYSEQLLYRFLKMKY